MRMNLGLRIMLGVPGEEKECVMWRQAHYYGDVHSAVDGMTLYEGESV